MLVRNGINCKRCKNKPSQNDSKYCVDCILKYNPTGTFDLNADHLLQQILNILPDNEILSNGSAIPDTKAPWAGEQSRGVKPDAVLIFKSIVIIFEADEDDGHSASGGGDISKWGEPWQFNRDLNAERAKMQVAASISSARYGKRVLCARINSDNRSIRIPAGDIGCATRAQLLADAIQRIESDTIPFPANSFRLALIDMPASRRQEGIAIPDSSNVFITWFDIQQTTAPNPKKFIENVTRQQREAQKARRAKRSNISLI
jgi:hypothetical protein